MKKQEQLRKMQEKVKEISDKVLALREKYTESVNMKEGLTLTITLTLTAPRTRTLTSASAKSMTEMIWLMTRSSISWPRYEIRFSYSPL